MSNKDLLSTRYKLNDCDPSIGSGSTSIDSGERKLAALGYTQQLNRGFSTFTNFAVSFSIISILTGLTSSFGISYSNGGPVSTIWGWVLVVTMTMFVGLAMAEIVSALPSSGGPYFWASVLGGRKWGPFAAFIAGWFNLLGQVAVTAAIEYSLASHLACMIVLGTGGAGNGGHVVTQKQLLGIYAAILFCHGIMNTIGTKLSAILNGFSSVWHIIGAVVMVITLLAVAPTHQSGKFVFATFYKVGTPEVASGITNNGYIFLIGMLMSQFTVTGFDACAHMSEETRGADKSAPIAIVLAIAASAVGGLAYLLAIMFSIQSTDNISPENILSGPANGYYTGQIFWDIFEAKYNHGGGAVVLMGIPMIAMFFCGMSSVISNSRMCWSFSRDHGLPFSKVWAYINPYVGVPVNAVWFMVTFAFLLGLPMLQSAVAFSAVVSISTIGLYISYAIPIFLRITTARKNFVKGDFHLGFMSYPIAIIAILWIAFVTVIFVLPTLYPVTSITLNYAPIAVGIVLVGTLFVWVLPVIGARHWYQGAAAATGGMAKLRELKDYDESVKAGTMPLRRAV